MPPPPSATSGLRHAVLLSAASAAVLAHEILLMRILSFAFWHHLAAMAVSMALLGFGAAGSFLFLTRERAGRDPDAVLAALAAAAALSLPGSLFLFRAAGLDPFQLVWQPGEWLVMAAAYAALSLPFAFAGGVVVVILSGAGERTPRLYAADLGGAGLGALAVVPALYWAPPWLLTLPLGGLLLLAAAPCARASRRPLRALTCLALAAGWLAALSPFGPPAPKVHETKGLPVALAFPDARVAGTRCGPQGLVHAVRSRAFHHVPGLSLQYGRRTDVELPEQMGLFVDGSGPEAVTRYTGDAGETLPFDYTARALAYHVRPVERALVLKAGGGRDVLLALHHGARRVHALEANGQVADLLTGPLAGFSGRLFERPGVELLRGDARRFLQRPGDRYDLILLSRGGGPGGESGGVSAAGESFLWTTEAFSAMIQRLTVRGMLSVSCWIQIPPRASLRALATALKGLRHAGAVQPEAGIVFIRSWNEAVILVSREPFSIRERERVLAFCDERGFDAVHVEGMGPERANRWDRLDRPWFFEGAQALLGSGREAFLEAYLYDVAPVTDDRPYGSRYFRWDRAPELLSHLRREWLPRVESGYVFLLATLVQAAAAGGAFILLPLCFLRGRREAWRRGGDSTAAPLSRTLLYFVCPGLGFMFFEMTLLPRLTLLLAHPVYAAVVVLSVMLVFAGLGSWSLERLQGMQERRLLWTAAGLLGAWLGLDALAGDRLVAAALTWSGPARLAVSAGVLALPAFLLGWPFPLGLRAVSRGRPWVLPWAWAVNACASVAGAVLAKVLAMSLGFQAVLGMGWALYVLAAWLFPGDGERRPA